MYCLSFLLGCHQYNHAQDRPVSPHEIARIDLDFAAASYDHYSTVFRQQGQVIAEINVRQHFKYYIDSATAGNVYNLL